MSIHAAKAHDETASSGLLLDASLSLARTQLVGQLADETSVDGRTMGTLGFSGALLAADLAARSVLGAFWWMPLLVLSVAALCCLGPTLGLGIDFARGTDLGPIADDVYRVYRAEPASEACEQLLFDLYRAFSNNASRLRAKERALWLAVVILVTGLPISAAFIALS
ncbi:MAG: hypothetical protein WA484_06595 [Solirubrobacteraceae bacterium]